MKKLTTLLLILIAAGFSPAGAASPGQLGPTSRGTVVISVSVAPRLRLTEVADSSSADRQWCVTLNTATGLYGVSSDEPVRWSGEAGDEVLAAGDSIKGLTGGQEGECDPNAAELLSAQPLGSRSTTLLIAPE